jgi:hypothetical protein
VVLSRWAELRNIEIMWIEGRAVFHKLLIIVLKRIEKKKIE